MSTHLPCHTFRRAHHRRSGLWLVFLMLAHVPSLSAEEREIDVSKGNTVSVEILGQPGLPRILWMHAEQGKQKSEDVIVRALADQGFAVWWPDWYTSLLLPRLPSSLEKIPQQDVDLVLENLARDDQQHYLVATGRAAVPVLRAAARMRTRPAGIVLISPNLYVGTPEPGQDPVFLPVVNQTRQNIHVLQPQLSPWFWRRNELQSALVKAGSKVQVQVLPGVRDRFYFRPDAFAREQAAAKELAVEIRNAIKAFSHER